MAIDTVPARLSDLPDVLTASQVASVLQCSEEHVYTMWRRNEMPHFKVGRLVRMHKQALIDFMVGGKGGGAEL